MEGCCCELVLQSLPGPFWGSVQKALPLRALLMRAKEMGVLTTSSHLSPAENHSQGINFQASLARILEQYLQYWGRAYTKKISVA